MNKIIIIGNLGRDPESRFTPSGQQVTAFPVAVNRQYTSNGEKVKVTTWFRVSAWGKTGELCNEYLKKGAKVCIEGRMDEPYAFVDKDGNAQATLQMTATEVEFLSSRGESSGGEQFVPEGVTPPEDDGELPF